MEYRLSAQCTDTVSGETGCFIREVTQDGVKRAITPIFRDLAATFPWMRLNGWKLAENVDGDFIPWRVVKG